MLTSVRLVQWRAHEDTTVPLDPRFTALVGANGTGKTSVLDAVFRVGRAMQQSPGVFSGVRSMSHTQRKGSAERSSFVAIAGNSSQAPWELRMRLFGNEHTTEANFELGVTEQERKKAGWHWRTPTLDRDRIMGYAPDGPSALQSSVLYRLSAERIADGDELTEQKPRIEWDGSGLATLLTEWKLNQPERFEAWAADVQAVLSRFRSVSFVRSVRTIPEPRLVKEDNSEFYRVDVSRKIYQTLLIDFDGEKGIAASAVSEGTLLVMTLLAAFHQETLPRIVMLDDIDRGLHPHAQQDLITLLRKILERKPQTQFIVTTHSPFVVDMLQPEQVVALARNSAGRVVAKRMSEHPKRHLLKQLSMGEFWSAEDEAWVVAEPAIAPETSEPRSHG